MPAASGGAGGWWPRINVSLQAVAQVLLVICLGAWLAARRNLNRPALNAVSSVNWHLCIPALMFSSIVGAVTPTNLAQLWPLILLSLLHVVLGLVPALLLGWAARLPRDLLFFSAMSASLPNCGNLPWLFLPPIISYFTPPASRADAITRSNGLVSVYTIFIVLLTLTVPFLFNQQRTADTLLLPRSRRRLSVEDAAADAVRRSDAAAASSAAAGAGAGAGGAAAATSQHRQQQQQQQQHQAAAGARTDAAGSHQAAVAGEGSAASPSSSSSSSKDVAAGSRGPDCLAHERREVVGHPAAPARHSVKQQQQQLLLDGGASPLPPCAAGSPAVSISAFELDVAPPQDADSLSQAGAAAAAADAHTPQPQQQQQQQPHVGLTAAAAGRRWLQPSAGPVTRVASMRSTSFFMHTSRDLLGGLRDSFSSSLLRAGSSSLGRSLSRSGSFVALTWAFPTGWQPQQQQQQQPLSGQQADSLARPTGARWWQQLRRCWRAFLDHPAINLPLGASIAGVACAAVGPVRDLFVREQAALHWLWLGLAWIGAAAAPLATMQIGAELMQAAPGGAPIKLPWRQQWAATGIAIGIKLLVVPLVNLLLLRRGGFAALVPADDTIYQLIMLVQGAVPAAVTLLVTCGRVYPDIRPLSRILWWQYVASLITLPAFLVWFLWLLGI